MTTTFNAKLENGKTVVLGTLDSKISNKELRTQVLRDLVGQYENKNGVLVAETWTEG